MATLVKFVTSLIDIFYPFFKRVMPLKTYRYLACGGANVTLDIGLFFILYNFVFQKQVVHIGPMAFEPHIAAFIFSFFVTFPIAFFFSKYIVWTGSTLRGHVQLFRYFLNIMINILLNYIFLKVFVEYLFFYPTIAKIITTGIIIVFSYLFQKHITFKRNGMASGGSLETEEDMGTNPAR